MRDPIVPPGNKIIHRYGVDEMKILLVNKFFFIKGGGKPFIFRRETG